VVPAAAGLPLGPAQLGVDLPAAADQLADVPGVAVGAFAQPLAVGGQPVGGRGAVAGDDGLGTGGRLDQFGHRGRGEFAGQETAHHGRERQEERPFFWDVELAGLADPVVGCCQAPAPGTDGLGQQGPEGGVGRVDGGQVMGLVQESTSRLVVWVVGLPGAEYLGGGDELADVLLTLSQAAGVGAQAAVASAAGPAPAHGGQGVQADLQRGQLPLGVGEDQLHERLVVGQGFDPAGEAPQPGPAGGFDTMVLGHDLVAVVLRGPDQWGVLGPEGGGGRELGDDTVHHVLAQAQSGVIGVGVQPVQGEVHQSGFVRPLGCYFMSGQGAAPFRW
jgi:hypothetical protein